MVELTGVRYCKPHKFVTYSEIEFSKHLAQYPHYTIGDKTFCANCNEKIDGFLVPISTLGEPVLILCDQCKSKLNHGLKTIGITKDDPEAIRKLAYG